MLNAISLQQDLLIHTGSETVTLPIRVPYNGEYVVIDALNFVCDINTFAMPENHIFETYFSEILANEKNVMKHISHSLIGKVGKCIYDSLKYAFGDFGELYHLDGKLHFYNHRFAVKNAQGEVLMNIGFGGQNDTVLIMLTGQGCVQADIDWESRLHFWLDNVAQKAKITRIDLAHDDLDGAYSSVDFADEQESKGQFCLEKTNTKPQVHWIGEWKNKDPNKKGRTFQVGSRDNGKVLRCYERGKKFGDKESLWTRTELEIHNKKRYIPFDVLLNPTEYFCGAYPFCYQLIDLAKNNNNDNAPTAVNKIPVFVKQTKISLQKSVDIIKHQFGKYFKVFGEVFNQDFARIFELVCTDKKKDYYPKRLLSVDVVMNNPPSYAYTADFENRYAYS